MWAEVASINAIFFDAAISTTIGGVDRIVVAGFIPEGFVRHVWTYTPETEVVAYGVVNAAPLRPLNWGPSVETERRGSGLDVVYVGNTISKFLYESYDGATWTEVATPGQVTAMTVGDDGYV